MTAEPSFDWIQRQVAEELELVPIALDQRGVETVLEEMAIEGVAMVESLRKRKFSQCMPTERSSLGVSSTKW